MGYAKNGLCGQQVDTSSPQLHVCCLNFQGRYQLRSDYWKGEMSREEGSGDLGSRPGFGGRSGNLKVSLKSEKRNIGLGVGRSGPKWCSTLTWLTLPQIQHNCVSFVFVFLFVTLA